MPCGFATRKVAALKSITLLTYPRLTASSGLLSRCFLHLCYDWSLCLAQLAPAYGVTSMPFLPGCHRPFHRSNCLRSLPLLSLWLLTFLFVWISFFASATLSILCFSMSSRQPSSLSGPSPRISTAGAYCCRSIITPRRLGGSQVLTPDGVCGR